MNQDEAWQWSPKEKLLIYGIGNVGRQDDGLGIRFIEKLSASKIIPSAHLEANYQLNVEDALLISEYDVVLFVDAWKDGGIAFQLTRVWPVSETTLTTHAMRIEAVLALAGELYGAQPRAYALAIAGQQWGIAEELSPAASSNLDKAFSAVVGMLEATHA